MLSVHQSQASVASSLVPTTHNRHSNRLKASPTKSKRMLGPWKLGQQLGAGSTCTVVLGTHVDTNQKAAIKIVNKNHLDPQELSPNEVDASGLPYGIQREIIIMKLLNNKNILKLYDVYESKNHLYLITEYVANGELFDYLVNVDPLPEPQALCVFYELMNGVFFLHNWGIVHRDLKLENILIDSEMHLKIADFGMATLELLKYESNTENNINNNSDQDSLLNDRRHEETSDSSEGKGSISTIRTTKKVPAFLLETSCGSPHYAAPEVVASLPYNGLKSDMWSCGVIYYALLSGKLPFDDENIKKLLSKVKAGVFEMPEDISEESKELISGLLCSDPEKRLDAEGVLKSTLFKKYNIGFYSSDPEQHNYYNNINVFTNSINHNLIKTNKDDDLIINNYNFSKKVKNDVANLDEDILEHLLILYHHKKDITEIIQNLVNNKVNIDKVFYSLLIGFDHNSTRFITKKDIDMNDMQDDENDLDNIGSYPATLKMNRSKMTKTYSNISIVVSQHKRNISFKGLNTRSSSIRTSRSRKQHSLYKYSQKGLKSSKSLLQKSNKSISSVYNPSQMRPSHSMASYNGSMNLSQYLSKDFQLDDEFEDEEEPDVESLGKIIFHDEPVNVLSPGVPISYNPFDGSPIKQLTSTYNKLQISELEYTPRSTSKSRNRKPNQKSNNKKGKSTHSNISGSVATSNTKTSSLLDDDFSFENKPNLKLAKEFSFKGDYNSLDSPVNYKSSPKRTKRYKTSGYVTPENFSSPTGSPIRYRNKFEKTNGNAPQSVKKYAPPHKSRMRNSGSSRRTIKSTLSSKVMSNYAKVNEGYNDPVTMSNYLDSSTKETKSEFELMCDQMFGKSSDNYNSLFGENYFDRKAKEAEAAAFLEKHKREKELEKKREKERLKKTGRLNINVNPISRLDPGLYNDNTDTSSNSIFLNDDSFDSNHSNNYSNKKNARKIANEDFQDSSLMFSAFNNEEFSDMNAGTDGSYGATDVLGLSYNNTSATTDQMYYNSNNNNSFAKGLEKDTPTRYASTEKTSFGDNIDDFEYVTKSNRGFSNEKKLSKPSISTGNGNNDEMFPVYNGEHCTEIPKKNRHLDSTYHKKSFLASDVQFTDISNSPFRKDVSDNLEAKDTRSSSNHSRKVSSSLTEQVIKDENLEGKRKISQISSSSDTANSNLSNSNNYFNKPNVRVFSDANDSLNLITNGLPGSSKNLILKSPEESAGAKSHARHSVDGGNTVKRKSSILRRFSLNGNNASTVAVEKSKILTTVKEIKIESNAKSQSMIDKKLAVSNARNIKVADTKTMVATTITSKTVTRNSRNNKRSAVPSPSANEFSLTLSTAQSIIAIRSLLHNWKKYGIKNIRVQNNVVTGVIKNPHRKFFSLSPTTSFKLVLEDEGGNNSKLEIYKTKGSDKIFDKFVEEFLQVLIKEKVFRAE